MAIAKVFSLNKQVVGEIELSDAVFAAPVNRHLIWEAVNHFLAAARAGTACTKTRGQVAGSGRKLWKQKGTGRARVGDIRTPKWKGGGTVHGPKPRSYDYAFPKKKRRGALRSALSSKFAAGAITVVDTWQLEDHKTKTLKKVLDNLVEPKRVLVIDSRDNLVLQRASGNVPTYKFVGPMALSIHDVLKYDVLVISKDAVMQIQEVLSK